MSTQTLPDFMSVLGDKAVAEMSFATPTITDDVMTIVDLPVFRTGTFKDAYGEEATFDKYVLDMFVLNFDHLKENKIYENVPVRLGHRKSPVFSDTDPLKDVVGYVDSIRTEDRKSPIGDDENTYTYLLATVRIIDKNAQNNINNGLWLERSAELGIFTDNSGIQYAPCFLGFAYVDLGAVRGLNFASENKEISIFTTEENMTVPVPPTPGSPTTEKFKFTIGGNETYDFEKVQKHIIETENAYAAAIGERDTEKKRADELQTVVDAQKATERLDFVNGLVESNKILASSKDATMELVNTFSDSQFESWKKTYDNAPGQSVLGGGARTDNPSTDTALQNQQYTQQGEDDAAARSLKINKNVLFALRKAGKSDDQLKQTAQYAAILEAEPNFKLTAGLTRQNV